MPIQIPVGPELRMICQVIANRNFSESEWAARESDAEFRVAAFSGGFDATEGAFYFSYYDSSSREYWFQLSLPEVKEVASGSLRSVEAGLAEQKP